MDEQISIPKFHLENVVRCNEESSYQLLGEIAITISRKYIKTENLLGESTSYLMHKCLSQLRLVNKR